MPAQAENELGLEGLVAELLGGDHDDNQLIGGSGNDQLFGNNGNDTIAGGSRHDSIHDKSGDNVIRGFFKGGIGGIRRIWNFALRTAFEYLHDG